MKRISEIKDLLSIVYFNEEVKEYVIGFLEEIGMKGAKSLVVSDVSLMGIITQRKFMTPRCFFEQCIGHTIGEIFTIDTATSMAIEDYKYQVEQLKKKQDDNQEQIDMDKGNLYALLMISMCREDSLRDILKAIGKDSPETAEEIKASLKRAIA